MITAAVARENVDDLLLEGERYVDKSALRSVFGYSVAIAVFILIIFVVIVVIRLLGFGVINQFWVVFGIMVCDPLHYSLYYAYAIHVGYSRQLFLGWQ